MSRPTLRLLTSIGALFLAMSGSVGCGSSGPTTYPAQGQVQLATGDSRVLAGHALEAALETDSQVRAYAEIGEDGRFALESLLQGTIRQGALPGRYRVRLILSEDDPERRRQAADFIPARFLQFDTSEFTIEVPAANSIILALPTS